MCFYINTKTMKNYNKKTCVKNKWNYFFSEIIGFDFFNEQHMFSDLFNDLVFVSVYH